MLCKYAAFLSESIIREIIKGRYLEPVVGYSSNGLRANYDSHKNATSRSGGEQHNEGDWIKGEQAETYGPGRSWIVTRPRFKVITIAKWEPNMTMKYHVASCAMTSKIVGTLSPGTFDFFARKMINEKAIRSDAYIFIGKVSAVRSRFEKD